MEVLLADDSSSSVRQRTHTAERDSTQPNRRSASLALLCRRCVQKQLSRQLAERDLAYWTLERQFTQFKIDMTRYTHTSSIDADDAELMQQRVHSIRTEKQMITTQRDRLASELSSMLEHYNAQSEEMQTKDDEIVRLQLQLATQSSTLASVRAELTALSLARDNNELRDLQRLVGEMNARLERSEKLNAEQKAILEAQNKANARDHAQRQQQIQSLEAEAARAASAAQSAMATAQAASATAASTLAAATEKASKKRKEREAQLEQEEAAAAAAKEAEKEQKRIAAEKKKEEAAAARAEKAAARAAALAAKRAAAESEAMEEATQIAAAESAPLFPVDSIAEPIVVDEEKTPEPAAASVAPQQKKKKAKKSKREEQSDEEEDKDDEAYEDEVDRIGRKVKARAAAKKPRKAKAESAPEPAPQPSSSDVQSRIAQTEATLIDDAAALNESTSSLTSTLSMDTATGDRRRKLFPHSKRTAELAAQQASQKAAAAVRSPVVIKMRAPTLLEQVQQLQRQPLQSITANAAAASSSSAAAAASSLPAKLSAPLPSVRTLLGLPPAAPSTNSARNLFMHFLGGGVKLPRAKPPTAAY